MKLIIFITLTILSFPSFSAEWPSLESGLDTHIKFGGWSKHQSSRKYGNYDFNESHSGLGIQLLKGIEGSNWHFGVEYFQMKDSLNKDARMYSLASKYEWNLSNKILTSIDLLTGITYHDRSFLHHDYHKKNGSVTVVKYDIYRDTMLAPTLMVTFRLFDRLDVDVMHVPTFSSKDYAVTFFRLGVKL